MFRTLALIMLLTTPAAADTYMSDAFGILPETALSPERAAWSGLRDGVGSVTVEADAPDAILVFIGPKALVAGKDEGHAVALAFDRHGNLAQDAEAVFSLESSGVLKTDVQDGIAGVLFIPEPLAGTYSGGTSIGNLQSPRALYRVTADLESVIATFNGGLSIRNEAFETVASAELTDQYGNPIEDGVGATVILSHENGPATILSATVREATAETKLLGRDMSTGGTAALFIGMSSGSAAFAFQPQLAASAPDIQIWSIDEIGAIGLRLGPITTLAGHLLTDGSPVQIVVTDNDGNLVQTDGWLQDGYFEAVLRRPSISDALTVTFGTAVGSESRLVTIYKEAPNSIRGAE